MHQYGVGAGNTVEENASACTQWTASNVLVAVSKGMQAVKLRLNKILHFLTEGVG